MNQASPKTSAPPWDPEREVVVAWRLAAVVLVTLLLVKPLGSIPWLGPIAFTLAAGLQLYLPIWRMDTLRLDYSFLGLHTERLRDDLRLVGVCCLVTFVPFALGHHLFMTHARDWVVQWGFPEWASFLPHHQLAPRLPVGLGEWGDGLSWFAVMALTHLFGVALPEETFYRGYLQPRLEERWPPKTRFLGVALGRAAVICAALFALGHFLGEWNPLRLGPFLPGLLFAWLRNATGSIFGAIGYHALCNIFGELLFQLYQPV
jgi:hypothetical protein